MLYNQEYNLLFGNICNDYHFLNVTFDASNIWYTLDIDGINIVNATKSYDNMNYNQNYQNLVGPFFFKAGKYDQ